jgi:uncharacterized membrane protein HdeD (DUF308 family)
MNTSLFDFFEEIKDTVKNWWVSLILGILFITVSLILMFYPVEGYQTLVIMFCACMFASGVLEVIFSLSNRKILSGWGWYLTCGIIDILIGIFLIYHPALTAAVIPYILAFWIMFRGFTAIGFSIDLRHVGINGWGWYTMLGILAILCSIAIIWQPVAGAFLSVYVLAFGFMFLGFFRIMLSFELRNLYKNSQKLKNRLNSDPDQN